eukprot:CAMPEP_0204556958 /NCGR_PEP_ID=MMETSP0661-20131031/29977_1 /ASSEMBLY_ACC=CAM_ASM_000606 /TAXON_ID=109239 /ORGANISM="Alexandrium margalefi, Strain AMGDE01CS-322" /LENGTH=158 /DNA_ID=CAMNT_0051564071 /DNA_START=9 /DNA_END=483 /DNA_ORIENTATION=-
MSRADDDAQRHPTEPQGANALRHRQLFVDAIVGYRLILLRCLPGIIEAVGRGPSPNRSAHSWPQSLLQAKAGVGRFHPAYLVLPLLGLGAMAVVVLVLFLRVERELVQGEAAFPERPRAKDTREEIHSARSLRSPLPSMERPLRAQPPALDEELRAAR